MELIEVIAAKLHGIKVTESALNYHGSITIDENILKAAGMIPLEFVYVWNKMSGARISTYILPGKAGSGQVCLNGAAARSCQIGDEVIISSSRRITPDELGKRKPKVVTFCHNNKINEIDEILTYDLQINNDTNWSFNIKTEK